ncbi:HNH endonuclease family protein [Streptomyces sp. NPDC055992]|uniref:HNH endonuclease family protein n=1 Tax=Streptomyces sp. NPDC055992 TaxID=3345673 RepID=UPI0035DD159D
MRILVSLAAAAAALAALTTPTHAEPGPLGEKGSVLTLPLADALRALPVADEERAGYERTKFKHWVDADKDGCNTRNEVLLAEAVVAPEQGARCKLSGGQWYSPYSNTYVDNPSGLDIDHLVPLAESWDSGASAWTPAEREAYANDLDEDRSLIAVTAATNRSKADQDPAQWMPPYQPYHCQYLTDWIATKLRWQLTIDNTERNTLTQATTTCPNKPVHVTLAR